MFTVHMLEMHILTVMCPLKKNQKSYFFKELFLDKHQMVHSLNEYQLCQVLHSTHTQYDIKIRNAWTSAMMILPLIINYRQHKLKYKINVVYLSKNSIRCYRSTIMHF